jgi:hypothetical protein
VQLLLTGAAADVTPALTDFAGRAFDTFLVTHRCATDLKIAVVLIHAHSMHSENNLAVRRIRAAPAAAGTHNFAESARVELNRAGFNTTAAGGRRGAAFITTIVIALLFRVEAVLDAACGEGGLCDGGEIENGETSAEHAERQESAVQPDRIL